VKRKVAIQADPQKAHVNRAMGFEPGVDAGALGFRLTSVWGKARVASRVYAQGINQMGTKKRLTTCRVVPCESTPLIELQDPNPRERRGIRTGIFGQQVVTARHGGTARGTKKSIGAFLQGADDCVCRRSAHAFVVRRQHDAKRIERWSSMW